MGASKQRYGILTSVMFYSLVDYRKKFSFCKLSDFPPGMDFFQKRYIIIRMNTHIFLEHHFELSPQEVSLFGKFLDLFVQYNAHTNLSAIRDEEGIVEKHFVDSLYGSLVIHDFF